MSAKEIEQISNSSLIIIGNYTCLHMSVILASKIPHISLYFYCAFFTSYLCVSLWSYSQAVSVCKTEFRLSVSLLPESDTHNTVGITSPATPYQHSVGGHRQ